MCYARTSSGGTQWTGNPLDGLTGRVLPTPTPDAPKLAYYPNGPQAPAAPSPLPTIGTPAVSSAAPSQDASGLTITQPAKSRLGSVGGGSGINVPS